ncbi:HAMP domain-containing histidine kinase [Streptomyces sp. YC504]|uniref:histidine kinase n=1 Tax=Streptomyces mesophilus TaxID=1775132 RepID=A0A6G4XNY7_9ACTN|nr:HAMP domain-containing sensor histidine kinase [Streptomyces mesophilus]NGO79299.1 HAMP domain-containing histidine kinase [Streptomyces mesophilus]
MKAPRRLARISLRTRLTLVFGLLFLLAGLVLLGTTYGLFQQQLRSGGTKFVSMLGKDIREAEDAEDKERRTPDEAEGPRDQKRYAITPEGDILTGATADRWIKAQQARVDDAASTSLLTQGGIALLVVGGAAAGFGWLVAGRVLAPLHRVTDTARRIAAAPAADRGLHERIALTGRVDEVKELADTFDTMVERLDRSFDGQRRFVANASHELRTPLTLGRALVEVAMHRRTASEDVKQLGENLLEINSRHERLISGLLLLADSENAVTERHPVDLADMAAHVVAQVADQARAAGVTVRSTAAEAPTAGDALLLERLVHNLVENAVRHNAAPDGWVEITTGVRTDGRAELRIANSGPVVPPYEIPRLFEPFRRLGAERVASAKGAGLGLSIVRSIAGAHDGEVRAEPRTEGGLVVTVVLPGGG